MTQTPKVLEFEVVVDRDRTASSGRGGTSIPAEEAWLAEHLVLAGLVRCTLASLDHAAGRAGVTASGAGKVRGLVTKRDEDGLYALVDIESTLEVEVEPRLEAAALRDLIQRAERGCFVGNSLRARPRYRWIVNGDEVS